MATIQFSLPVEAAAWLEEKAKEHGLSMASLLRKSIANYIVTALGDDCLRTPPPDLKGKLH
jgi:ribbon-helix-helix CopG family protein